MLYSPFTLILLPQVPLGLLNGRSAAIAVVRSENVGLLIPSAIVELICIVH